MSHYDTLGVSKTATPEEIKKAYRKLASQHHPDKGGDTAKFQEIEEAYSVTQTSVPNTITHNHKASALTLVTLTVCPQSSGTSFEILDLEAIAHLANVTQDAIRICV